MQRVILVVSPDPDFIQQIRSHLEEGGRFHVSGASNGHDALTLANTNFYDVAILDGDVNDIPLPPLSNDLVALQPNIKILIFAPENNPNHAALEGSISNGFLRKPFFGPEIGNTLANLFMDLPTEPDNKNQLINDLVNLWLERPETGAKRIETLHQMTTADAAMLMVKDQVIAVSGILNEDARENVVGFMTHYWREEENYELARYLRMSGSQAEQFLYATRLVGNIVFVLLYDPGVSIQKVRLEIKLVRDGFQAAYPNTGAFRQEIANQTLVEVQERSKKLETAVPFTGGIDQSELDALVSRIKNNPVDDQPALSEKEITNLDEIIATAPLPDPEEAQIGTATADKAQEENTWLPLAAVDPLQPTEHAAAKPVEVAPANPALAETATDPFSEVKLPWETEEGGETSTRVEEVASIKAETLSENIPAPVAAEEIPAAPVDLEHFRFNYTCILVPANRSQFLARDLSEKISAILPQFHQAQGWRLTSITLRPQYLLWTVATPFGVCPHQLIKDVRKHTSENIFASFPDIAREEGVNDFWSNDFLVVSGSEPPPVNLLFDFIAKALKTPEAALT